MTSTLCRISEETVEEGAATYVTLLESPANGWGQNVHPVYGISHNVLLMMQNKFGKEAFEKAVVDAFAKLRETKKFGHPGFGHSP